MEPADRRQELPFERVGAYRLLCELGRGEMAVVYLARLEGPGGFERLCALKMIHAHLSDDPEFVDLLLSEARIAARIRHPNVISVDELAMHEGRYYLRMDYVSGETLFQALDRTWNRDQPFPEAMAAQIIGSAADGLHAAHELRGPQREPLGVVHRDLGPHNVLLGYDGVVRLMDFGIAKALDRRLATQPGTLRGTVAFMSPEQVRGQPLDRRADLFSLGVLLWETSVGARLFKHPTLPGTMARILEMEVPRPSSLRPGYPPELEAIVMKALERDREKRHPTAQALGEELAAYLGASGHVATAASLERFMSATFADRKAERLRVEEEAESLAPAERLLSRIAPLEPGELRTVVAPLERSALEQSAGLSARVTPEALEAPTAVTDVERRPQRRVQPSLVRRRATPWGWWVAAMSCLAVGGVGAVSLRGSITRRAAVEAAPVRTAMVTLSFELQPADARLTVDGQAHQGDLVVPLSPQAYAVEVRAQGYSPKSLVVSAEASQHIQVFLEPAPRQSRERGRAKGRGRRAQR